MFACSYLTNYVTLWKVGAKLHGEIGAQVEKDIDVLKLGGACIQITSCLTNLVKLSTG